MLVIRHLTPVVVVRQFNGQIKQTALESAYSRYQDYMLDVQHKQKIKELENNERQLPPNHEVGTRIWTHFEEIM